MRMLMLLAAGCCATQALAAAWPPPERLLDWKPGVAGGIPEIPVAIALKPADLPADGKTDASAAIQKAIDAVQVPGAVLLPEGAFRLEKRLSLRSGVVLRGAGLDKTRLVVNAPNSTSGGSVEMRGEKGGEEFAIASGAALNSTRITLAAAAGLQPGALVWVYADNDPALMYTKPEWKQNWAENSMGQVLHVKAVQGADVTLDTPLYLDYKAEFKPRLRVLSPIRRAGLEDLHILREDRAEDSIVGIFYAEDCWVRNVETERCMRYHIDIRASRRVTVESCYAHHAHDRGGGGHGYGIEMTGCASDCLVWNCVLHSLRHAMIVQVGANGGVYAYNFSFDTAGSDNAGKAWWHSNDVSIHGHYPYALLFEGNVVQCIGVGDYWGPAGPRMTFFRNRIAAPEKEADLAAYAKLGIHPNKSDPWPRFQMNLTVKDSSHGCNVIGNTFTDGAPLKIDPSCKDTLAEGNLFDGQLKWNQAQPCPLPASLFLKEKPAFWGEKPWPAIGADVDAKGMTPIPAQDWYARIKRAGKGVPFFKVNSKQ
ncbi:MAG: glycoside hydrolase family 55 protein [Planctomycetota bacterium]|nr:glycoside hydrolase family 55 protein [Planctomycetota bacterium]